MTAITWNTAPYRCAMMNLYSGSGFALTGPDNKYGQNERYLINEGNVEYCHIEGSNHFALTDLVRELPALCAVQDGSYATPGEETLKQSTKNASPFSNGACDLHFRVLSTPEPEFAE